MPMTLRRLLILSVVATAFAGCTRELPFDDPFEQNTVRSQSVTLSAGNAEKSNEVVQIIDPWPRYVYDTHIAGDGQRMAAAVDRYKDVTKLKEAAKPISPLYDVSGGATTVTGTTP
ncbi:MAG: hypothetical protein JOY90_27450 [Bradyrhizobium sp.]|uniref:hypothetical protein n=1 Tax=Bradyrhizobium sp. TaxID=376 RepID=UPI001DE7A2B2|nr:hypothetical protein [Bradyrhizobium sp.]MBV9564149.1 hypothetical protein [Bradyrhizobium sp.]